MVKLKELWLNVVINNKRKTLKRLNQKVCSQITCFSLGSHGYEATSGQTEPNPSDKLSIRNMVSPYSPLRSRQPQGELKGCWYGSVEEAKAVL
jgi:hypothetical protein